MDDMRADLFAEEGAYEPLAAKMRPTTLEDYVGQEHIIGVGTPLRRALEAGKLHSLIFWGPPGVGKTTLAKLLANYIDAAFLSISAVMSGVKEIREAVQEAQQHRSYGRKTILFVDEVHRFNKSQQDAFLPYVEDGTFIFIGATTENPSFELNNALLSRCRVYILRSLEADDIQQVLQQALQDTERGLGSLQLNLAEESLETLIKASEGDARKALNLLEIAADLAEQGRIDQAVLGEVLGADVRRFDKGGDLFYEQISALHKAVRGSSPDGALYWMIRMLDGGCDPLYVARRLVRIASEDIGNADPRALPLALAAWDTQERLGHPEGQLAIAQAAVYLACAPKSNAVYNAFNRVTAAVREQPAYDVPVHLRNAPTKLLKSLDYGAEYRYAHDEPEAYAAGENYLPPELADERYYQPVERGLEQKIAAKLEYLRGLDRQSTQQRYKE